MGEQTRRQFLYTTGATATLLAFPAPYTLPASADTNAACDQQFTQQIQNQYAQTYEDSLCDLRELWLLPYSGKSPRVLQELGARAEVGVNAGPRQDPVDFLAMLAEVEKSVSDGTQLADSTSYVGDIRLGPSDRLFETYRTEIPGGIPLLNQVFPPGEQAIGVVDLHTVDRLDDNQRQWFSETLVTDSERNMVTYQAQSVQWHDDALLRAEMYADTDGDGRIDRKAPFPLFLNTDV